MSNFSDGKKINQLSGVNALLGGGERRGKKQVAGRALYEAGS